MLGGSSKRPEGLYAILKMAGELLIVELAKGALAVFITKTPSVSILSLCINLAPLRRLYAATVIVFHPTSDLKVTPYQLSREAARMERELSSSPHQVGYVRRQFGVIEGQSSSRAEQKPRGRAPMRRTNPDWWKTNP
jgi:hypothetical protein